MQEILGTYKEWHTPRNEECPHNRNVERDCTCKRPRIRKPYRRVAVNDDGVGHTVNPHLIFEIYPDGSIALREKGRKKRFHIRTSRLYSQLMWEDAKRHKETKRQMRLAKRKARKEAKQ
jgi:hypothetical protein